MSGWNEKVFETIHNWSGISPSFDRIIIFCATHLWWILVAAVILFYTIMRRSARGLAELSVILFSGVVSYLGAYVIKHIVEAPRPGEVLQDLPMLLQKAAGTAFPSGHTALVFGIAIALFFYDRFLGIAALVVALLVGLARVASGLHWPIDILGGIVVGGIVALVIHAIASIFLRNGEI